MLPDNMRPVPPTPPDNGELIPEKSSRVITVRLTPTQWRAAKRAAHFREQSLNLFCVDQIERGIAAADADAEAVRFAISEGQQATDNAA